MTLPDKGDIHRMETMHEAINVFRREYEDEDVHLEDAVRAAAFFAYMEARADAESREASDA